MTIKMADALIGQSLGRFEDFALSTGRGRYPGDLPMAAGTMHAVIVRSTHPDTEILAHC
jgi:CO/xanthine dehydrogenase Mo-binding subunit